jgi:hypothetical protein
MPEGYNDVPIDEIPEFQSFIYEEWGQIEVEVDEINEHIEHRKYFGFCSDCGDKCLLGYIKMVDNEPVNLYVPIEGPEVVDD